MNNSKLCLIALLAGLSGLIGGCAGQDGAVGSPPASQAELTPPVAALEDYIVHSANGDRNDPYYWMRDDKRENPKLLNHLKAENAWTDAYFERLQPLQKQLFNEMKARILEDDSRHR